MSQEIGYCGLNAVKDRLLIATDDTSYNDSLTTAICEASRLVDTFLRAYTTVPLAENDVTSEISMITADFAASIFKRRMMPEDVTLRGALQPDQLNQIDATGWFALGIRKLEQYIKSKYVIQNKALQSTIYNPELYIELFNRGLITGAEVRQFIVNPDVKIVEHKEKYEYSRQKTLKVVKGKEDSEQYEVLS
jgi:hypothetical protein